MPDPQAPFWRRKAMTEMTHAEWESLCDGCGRCCLNKLIDEDTNETVLHRRRLQAARRRQAAAARDYANRQAKVKDCVRLTPRNVRRLNWLPPTCGYRLVAEGKDLAWWHPLVSGDPETVHTAGVSVRGRVAASETDVPDEKLEDYIVSWPGKWPKGAKRQGLQETSRQVAWIGPQRARSERQFKTCARQRSQTKSFANGKSNFYDQKWLRLR